MARGSGSMMGPASIRLRPAVARYREGAIWWLDERGLVASAKAQQDQRYHADAWDARIDRWLVYERRRVNHGYTNYDDWRDEEIERPNPLTDVSVGEILEGTLDIEPARWTKADQMRVGAYLKTRQWERYQARSGAVREWRYRRSTDVDRSDRPPASD